ncbi:MAG: hypothetical protein AAB606_01550 [Patescibacteria group bacterium]
MDENKESQGSPEAAAQKSQVARFEHVLMKEAYEAISNGKFSSAATIFEDLLRRFGVTLEDSQKSVIHSELGTVLFWLGDYDAAFKHCENALAYGQNNDQAYIILGKVATAQFKFALARGYFSKVSDDNPGKHLGFCLVAIKVRDTKTAVTHLTSAVAMLPRTNIELMVYSAYIYLLKGETKDSVILARELVSKIKGDPHLLLLLAEILMTAGHYGEASAITNQVALSSPENDQIFAIRAHAAYFEEKLDAAGNYAHEAVRLNPYNAYAKTILMKLATRSGNYATAENIGREILQQSSDYSLGHANLGDVYFIQGQYELAQIEYEQTMALMDSQTKGALLRQARMLFIASDFQGAARILDDLINSHHTYYDDAMCDLALCYDQIGDEKLKEEVVDKMKMRRTFYHRTEKLLQQFGNK